MPAGSGHAEEFTVTYIAEEGEKETKLTSFEVTRTRTDLSETQTVAIPPKLSGIDSIFYHTNFIENTKRIIGYLQENGMLTKKEVNTAMVLFTTKPTSRTLPDASTPTAPPAAPTPPTRNAWDVVSLYSDAYTDVALNFDAGWCGSDSVETVEIAGNNTVAFKGNNCQGIVLDEAIDVSAFTHMHVDVYIDENVDVTSKVFNLKFVGTPTSVFKEYPFNAGSSPALVAGTWLSIDIPVDLSTMSGFKEFGVTADNLKNEVWYDNLYVYRAATASVENNELLGFSMFPNPASDRLHISAKETIQNADIFNVLGKKVMSVDVNDTKTSINISNLSSGIYLVKYNVGNTTGTAKFIKQ